MPVVMNEWNLQSFSGQENGRAHRANAGLFPAEKAILDVLGRVPSGDVLDLGVGTGRTVPFLLPRARTYVGIDYAPVAIEEARTNVPGADLRVMDARDLSAFADSSFDLALFGYNGIDYVDHAGRLRIIAEVHRVLRAGGWFVFSFHNRDFAGLEAARRVRRINWFTHPVAVVRDILRRRRATRRRAALAEAERVSSDYIIVNDCGMNFGLLTYCTTAAIQAGQLQRAGFTNVTAHDLRGKPRSLQDPFSTDNMIHMAAQKS